MLAAALLAGGKSIAEPEIFYNNSFSQSQQTALTAIYGVEPKILPHAGVLVI